MRFTLFAFALLAMMFAAVLSAQSITSGDIIATVTDQTGAVVANATVTLTNEGTGAVQRGTTNAQGAYRFSLLPPGSYSLTVGATGFAKTERKGIPVQSGQPTNVTVQLPLATESQTVNVSEAAPVLQTENADRETTFSSQQIQNLPNPGSDLTYIAQTAPGVVMNTQSGYGNFAAAGMPGTSNLFTINGQNYNDPYLNLNNSGASNLTLGANEIAEANVINNAYSAQYGQFAGTQVAYTTKSGTNAFHGDAIYDWNGRYLNANQFFSNAAGLPRPFNNYNQWAAGLQGPVWKNKVFFSANYEGLRNVLPTNAALVLVPSPQYQAATLANLAANGNANEIPFYKQVFGAYNSSPGASAATPVPGGGCDSNFTALGAGVPCADQFRVTPPNTNKEYQWAGRVDFVMSENDRAYVRVWRDNGFQPSFTSPFGSQFNDQSNQPQMSGQVSETHTFGPNTVNQFTGSSLFYAAVFVPSDPSAALTALPTFVQFAGNTFTGTGADEQPGPFYYPQGRRVWQYQILDDLSHVMGNHTFRMGFSWLHDNVTDLGFQQNLHGQLSTDQLDFYNGGGPATAMLQYFPSSPEEGLRFNTFGGYIADEWKVTLRLTVSLNLRLESYANPTCDANCFAREANTFSGGPISSNTPYNQLIVANQHNAFANTQAIVWEPRIGIAWRPFNSDKTVIRTGAGVFADELEGVLAEQAALNAPGLNEFNISNTRTFQPLAPGVPGSLYATAQLANQALLSQFASGGSFNSIANSVPGFSAPNFNGFPTKMNQPTYYKWNFEVEQDIGWKTMLSANYSGMHGIHIPIADNGLNGYCPPTACPNGFVGLPTAAPAPSFGTVTQFVQAGIANYNGLTVSLQHRFAAGLTFNASYTWSHAMDDVSNGGGLEWFGVPGLVTDPSVIYPQNPHNIRGDYGPSDYDVRNYFSASFVYTDMFRHSGFHWGPNAIFGGWTLASNWFARSGLPFTIIDGSEGAGGGVGSLGPYNYSGTIFATPLAPITSSCTSQVNAPCLTPSQFLPAGSLLGFGTIGRNSFYGPHFFDVDLALMKEVRIREHLTFSFGAQAYNLFNHPNFDQPVADISNGNFGLSTSVVAPPTSLLGSFVGAGASPRFLEIKGILRF